MENFNSYSPSESKEKKNNNEINEVLKETTNSINALAKELKQNLELFKEPTLKEAFDWINKALTLENFNNISPIKSIENINSIISKLNLSLNPIAKSLLNVIHLIQLKDFGEVSLEEIKLGIENIIEDKNLPESIKLKTIKWLKENDYLVGKSHQVVLQNRLAIKYPQYNWFNFEPTTDGIYTNLFSQNQTA